MLAGIDKNGFCQHGIKYSIENGHIEYYIGKEFFEKIPESNAIACLSAKTNDDKLLLRLDVFDVANLIESLFVGLNETQKYNMIERLRNV